MEHTLGKLRHIALATRDPQGLAAFYEKAFEFKRVGDYPAGDHGGGAVLLSDGTINLTLADFTDDQTGHGTDFVGLHHIGVVVDDVDKATQAVVELGATPLDYEAPATTSGSGFMEIKFRDPSGTVFDIAGENWKGSS